MTITAGSYLDRYKLVAQVGEGGQGAVWQAIDERTGRTVALKLHQLSDRDLGGVEGPQSRRPTDATHTARLRREAEALRQLAHPSLVRCLGMFEDYEHDVLGLVLEWIDGQTLNEAAKNPQMSAEHRMWLLGHLVRTLAYLHQSGIVHRDLKFGNVLVSPPFWQNPSVPDHIKLVDLGVAAPVGNPNPLTVMGAIVGTSAYVAPEIVMRGKNPTLSANTASDVFAFGVLGWRLLCGVHPTGLSLKSDFMQFVAFYQLALDGHDVWPAAGIVDGPWGEVLRHCLTLDVNERPRSAAEIVDQLEGRAPTRSDNEEIPTRFYIPPDRTPPPPAQLPLGPPPVPPPVPSSRASALSAPPSSRGSMPVPAPPTLTPTVPFAAPEPNRSSSPSMPAGMLPLPTAQSFLSARPSMSGLPTPVSDSPSMIPAEPTLSEGHGAGSSRTLVVVCVVAALVLLGGVVALLALRR